MVEPVIHEFSTDRLAPEQRFEAFRARINSMFDMFALQRGDEAGFSGSIRSVNLGAMLVSSMHTHTFAFERPRRRILRDFVDHILIRVDLDGPPETGGNARSLLVIDLGSVSEGAITPSHNISLVAPRRLLGLHDDDFGRLHGQRPDTPISRIFADHVVSVMRHATGISGTEAHALASLTPSLLAAVLKPEAAERERASRDIDLVSVRRARAYINDHLRHPGLSPQMVARAAGVSRATLYRLFEPTGGVARVIREMRLRQAMRDIAGLGANARLGEIGHALGFSSDAQFSNAFKAYFGIRPSDARAAATEGVRSGGMHPATSESGKLVFPDWLTNL